MNMKSWLSRLLILAAFVALPGETRADDAAPTALQTLKKKAIDMVPAMPALRAPSLPDFSVPDVASIKNSFMGEFNEFTQQVGATLPVLEAMGYEVTTFRVQWAVPPKAKLRLKSRSVSDPEKVAAAAAKAPPGMIASALVSSAVAAKNIQSTMKMGAVLIDIDFAVPPKIRMSFLADKAGSDNERTIEDIDLACGQAFVDR